MNSLFKKCIKNIPLIEAVVTVLAVYVTADKNSVVAYYFNVLPTDFYIVVPSQKAEAFTFAPDDDGNNRAGAGVNFNIIHTAEAATGFCIYYFFIS